LIPNEWKGKLGVVLTAQRGSPRTTHFTIGSEGGAIYEVQIRDFHTDLSGEIVALNKTMKRLYARTFIRPAPILRLALRTHEALAKSNTKLRA